MIHFNKPFALTAMAVLLAGCAGTPTPGEAKARRSAQTVTQIFRPSGVALNLPVLNADSPLGEYLRLAMLKQPRVAAAYYDWLATVETITVARSLPDPQLTFQADIASAVTSVMPGLMQAFPGPGKRNTRAGIATAMSGTKYFTFESAVLQTAFAVKHAYYDLWFLSEKIRINRGTLSLMNDLEKAARAKNEVGTVTLQDIYRAQIEQDRLQTGIANLEDFRAPLQARFKAALGLAANEPDPPFPTRLETTPLDLDAEGLLAAGFETNPRLKALEAEVRVAQAALGLALKAKLPDYSAGLMLNTRSTPLTARPKAGVSVPVWRDKIAAEIAGARAATNAADARLTAGQIELALDFAEQSYQYREATRNLSLLQGQLIPKARQSLEVARSGYLAGRIDFFNLIDAERTLLDFQLSEVGERTRREQVLARISLQILGVRPASAPLLPRTGNETFLKP
ncbi:MAG TPA: TolC family protein [Verrucomicrobiota bacterium]|jgi:outer membrane protein TolC|nr:TolC family protein [Verrucomicrobiota bacterium]